MEALRTQAERLPKESGVYYFKNERGRLLYIGKAKRLRRRVLQYINRQDSRQMIEQLLRESREIDFTITLTEKDALILEASEIQKHRPKFNVRLLDGSQFLHFYLDKRHPWPMLTLERYPKITKKVRIFGPYPDASAARKTLDFVNSMFPLRTCSDDTLKREKRPCLQHHMHRCLAPCVEKCTAEEYSGVVDQVTTFLTGNYEAVLKKTHDRMLFLSEQMRFEEAAVQRDIIRSIEKTLREQAVSKTTKRSIDYWAIHRVGSQGVYSILPFRKGRMQKAISIAFSDTIEESEEEMFCALLNRWYGQDVPHEIALPVTLDSQSVLTEVLTERCAHNVRIVHPKRGEKSKMLLLAHQNAVAHYQHRQSLAEQRRRLLLALQRKLRSRRLPVRIECFDNSNLQGTDPVAAMVVFLEGKAAKVMYKRFRIKEANGADDYAMMEEVLTRRFVRSQTDEHEHWKVPNLLVVDGGRGHVGIACRVLEDLGIENVEVIGFAKPRTERKRGDLATPDKIIIPDIKEPIILSKSDPVLLFLQRIRDEAHNTAVEYQRKVRGKKKLSSSLENIPGVGEKLRRSLLLHFGTVEAIRQASELDLRKAPLVGGKLAKVIHQYFHSESK